MKTLFIFVVLAIFFVSCAPMIDNNEDHNVVWKNTTNTEKPIILNDVGFSIDGFSCTQWRVEKNASWTVIYLGDTYNITIDHDLIIELTDTALTY